MIYFITTVIRLSCPITRVKKLADRLRYARKLRGLSQKQLAIASGVSQSAIANYETQARRQPKFIFQLAEALAVNPLWLLNGQGAMEPVGSATLALPAYVLAEHPIDGTPVLWPFASVSPARYWALPPGRRKMVEKAFASLVASLQDD